MAEIVLGMASPHAFGGGDPLQMEANRQKDSSDRRMNYAALLSRSQARCEIDCGRRLPDATLLIGYSDDSRHGAQAN